MAFNRAKNSVFYDCNFNDTGGSRTRIHGIDYLRESIAAGALYNSRERFDPPKCHAETRVAVLESIIAWVNHRQRTSSIMWLHGPAGAGKSAIAQTIAETCAKAKILCAAFFFSRTAAERNSVDRLLSTLLYQLVLAIPSLEELVTDAIEKDFTIFSLSFQEQLQRLVVEPLCNAVEQKLLTENCPQLIIIDGLDECAGPDIQKSILSDISDALTIFDIPLCFLISSRPEQAIRQAFNNSCALKITARLALDDSFDPDKDVDTFVRSKFNEIKQTHQFRSYPPDWPTDDAIRTLVDRSSGQFIYASVVMKYLGSPRKSPVRGLNIILGLVPPGNDNPYSKLDQLYHYILSTVDDYPATSRVLGVILYTKERDAILAKATTLQHLDCLLLLESGDTALLLSDLHSVIYVPNPKNSDEHSSSNKSDDGGYSSNVFSRDDRQIRFFHASFSDFLIDLSRSGEYYIDEEMFHSDLTLCSLRHWCHKLDYGEMVSDAKRDVQRHASLYGFYHLSRAAMTPHLLNELSTVDFLDVIKCGVSANQDLNLTESIESDAVLVLMLLSSLINNFKAGCVFYSLQNAMDLHHLSVLSTRSSSINETIYSLLAHIVCIDIGDVDHAIYNFIDLRNTRSMEYPFLTQMHVSRHYREWLLEFLSLRSRSKEYTMTKAQYEDILLGLLSPLHNARPLDINLQLVLSQVFKITDKTRKYLRSIVYEDHVQVSMRIDIWKNLQSNEQGSSADQSQSLELPTVLIIKDDNIYLRDIDSQLSNNGRGRSGESGITDEEGSGDTKSDSKAQAEQNGILPELREEEPLRHTEVEIVDGKPQVPVVEPRSTEIFEQKTVYIETKSSRRSSWMEGLKGVQRLFCCK